MENKPLKKVEIDAKILFLEFRGLIKNERDRSYIKELVYKIYITDNAETCIYWFMAGKRILLGKRLGIPKDDWLRVIEEAEDGKS